MDGKGLAQMWVEMWKDTELVKPGMRHIGGKLWPSIGNSRSY